eukprot:TRINITY_DN3118_c0_g1_i2.p1 TRINITY_DN3118_c0_g1~~TRINITY_DN3118_c0_g1_i2.p1  ORF type:complete len:398 (-),score=104.84 TRINITY_DN3118_c0_g1_i2:30-1223(-)
MSAQHNQTPLPPPVLVPRAQLQLMGYAPWLRQQETVLQEAAVIAKELCSHLTSWNKDLESVAQTSRSLAQSLRGFSAAVASSSSSSSSSLSSPTNTTTATDQTLCNVVSTVAETHLGYMTAQQSLSLSVQKTTSKVLEVVNRELRVVEGLTANYERARSQFNALVICANGSPQRRSIRNDDNSHTTDSTTSSNETNQSEEGGEKEEGTDTIPKESPEEKEAKLCVAREECNAVEREVEQRILAAINVIQLSTHDLVCCHSEEFSCFLSRLSFLIPSLHTTASHRKWIESKRAELQNASSRPSTAIDKPNNTIVTSMSSPQITRRKATQELLKLSVQIGAPTNTNSNASPAHNDVHIDDDPLSSPRQLPARAVTLAPILPLRVSNISCLLYTSPSPRD